MSSRTLFLVGAALVVLTVVGAGVLLYVGGIRGLNRDPAVLPETMENEKILYLFFPGTDPGGKELFLEARVVPADLAGTALAEEALRQLMAGPGGETPPIFAPGSELRSLYIDANGVVYVDVDRSSLGTPMDATGESVSLNAIFETLQRNVEGIRAVKILVDSEESDTLWGHVDGRIPWGAWEG